MSLAAVPLALAIDAATGDPDWLWRRTGHPVTWMGAAIDRLEERLNRRRRIDGVVALGALVGVFGAGALAVDALLPDNVVGLVIEALLASTLLAHRSLHQHVKAVADAPDLPAARRAVAMVVGRETATMDEAAVSRAALETLGENLVGRGGRAGVLAGGGGSARPRCLQSDQHCRFHDRPSHARGSRRSAGPPRGSTTSPI